MDLVGQVNDKPPFASAPFIPLLYLRYDHCFSATERVARAGHQESLSNWWVRRFHDCLSEDSLKPFVSLMVRMPLATWLGMALFDLLFPVLRMEDINKKKIMEKPPESTSKILLKMIGDEVGAKMEAAMTKMKHAITTGHYANDDGSEGIVDEIAELMELLSGIWLMKIGEVGCQETPNAGWLKAYLTIPEENEKYDAWAWKDKIFSIYSYYSFKELKPLPYIKGSKIKEAEWKEKDVAAAFQELEIRVGLKGKDLVASGILLEKILKSENVRLGVNLSKSLSKASEPIDRSASATSVKVTGRLPSNKVFPDVEMGGVAPQAFDPWSTLNMKPDLIHVLRANGITLTTAKELEMKLGVTELSDIKDVDEAMLKSSEIQVAPIQLKKVKAMIMDNGGSVQG